MENKTKTYEIMRFNSSYKNKKTNAIRVFINLPTWAGMKVYEITKHNSKIKTSILAECLYQGNNQKVAKLYNEIILHKSDEWIKIDYTENFINCIECSIKDCLSCDNYIF